MSKVLLFSLPFVCFLMVFLVQPVFWLQEKLVIKEILRSESFELRSHDAQDNVKHLNCDIPPSYGVSESL